MDYFQQIFSVLISAECYSVFFNDYNFFHVPCVKSIISRVLGYGIITGSMLVKVPQILKIVSTKSGEGISIVAQLLELYSILANGAYNYVKGFPFSAWGDAVFMLLQTIITVTLIMIFGSSRRFAPGFITFCILIIFVLCSGLTPVNILWSMQAVSVPIMFIGKMIQSYSNYVCKNMGQQSIVTSFLLFAGSIARIFTSVHETGDFIMILTYVLSTLGNSVLFFQFFIYDTAASKKTSEEKKKLK